MYVYVFRLIIFLSLLLLLTGEKRGNPAVAKQIEQYAASVKETGFYLDVQDAFLYAEEKSCEVVVAVPMPKKKSNTLQLELGLLSQELMDVVQDLTFNDAPSVIDRTSSKMWVLISVNATFDPAEPKNHWLPGFFKEQLTQKDWEDLTIQSQQKEDAEFAELAKKLHLLKFTKEKTTFVSVKALSEMQQAEQRMQELKNRKRIRDLCTAEGIAFYLVPADGNCLVWSLRILDLGMEHVAQSSVGQDRKEQRLYRTLLSNLWLVVMLDPAWQAVFTCLRPEMSASQPKTPKKENHCKAEKPEQKAGDNADADAAVCGLSTPPRVVQPEDMRRAAKMRRIGDAAPVPGFQARHTDSQLKMPGSTNKVRCMETAVPDVRDMFDKAMQKIPQHSKQPDGDPPSPSGDDDDEDELNLSDGNQEGRKRASHKRTCKRRTKTLRERERWRA